MKMKFQYLTYVLFAGLIGLSSCGEDDENAPAPTLTFTSGGAASGSFNSGETVDFTMTLSSTVDFTSLKGTLVYTDNGGASKTVTVKDANNGDAELNYTKNSDIKEDYAGTEVVKVALPSDAKRGTEWTLSVAAANSGGTTTATFKGKVVNVYTTKLMGAQSNSNGSYFNSATGNVLSGANASATPAGVDITYAALGSPIPLSTILSYKQRTAEGLIGVPAGAEESYFAETTLVPADFLSETKSWASLFTGVTIGTTQKVNIQTGKIYAFKNKAGKMGLIHVANIVDGLDGSVTIDVKAEN
jgi:hypothetical protein